MAKEIIRNDYSGEDFWKNTLEQADLIFRDFVVKTCSAQSLVDLFRERTYA